MKGTPEDFAMREHLRSVCETSGRLIEQSAAFLSLFTQHYADDPTCTLQLGIAVLLDKPIYLLVANGTVLGENMKRLARGIEYFERSNTKSLEEATMRLMKLAHPAGSNDK